MSNLRSAPLGLPQPSCRRAVCTRRLPYLRVRAREVSSTRLLLQGSALGCFLSLLWRAEAVTCSVPVDPVGREASSGLLGPLSSWSLENSQPPPNTHFTGVCGPPQAGSEFQGRWPRSQASSQPHVIGSFSPPHIPEKQRVLVSTWDQEERRQRGVSYLPSSAAEQAQTWVFRLQSPGAQELLHRAPRQL